MKIWGLVSYGWRLTRSVFRIGFLKLAGARIGKRVILESSLRKVPPSKILIGDGCVIEARVVIGRLSKLTLGDYVKVKEGTRIGGIDAHPKSLYLGSNSWIGEETTINTNEDVELGDNVGVGARSEIWTHGYFSNIADGYPYKTGKVVVGTGSVITKSLPPDVFATGTPCVVKQSDQWKYRKKLDPTQKMELVKEQFLAGIRDLGFSAVEDGQDRYKISKAWHKFHVSFDGDCQAKPSGKEILFVADGPPSSPAAGRTVIDITSNTYCKTGSLAEWIAIRVLLDRCVLRLVAAQKE